MLAKGRVVSSTNEFGIRLINVDFAHADSICLLVDTTNGEQCIRRQPLQIPPPKFAGKGMSMNGVTHQGFMQSLNSELFGKLGTPRYLVYWEILRILRANGFIRLSPEEKTDTDNIA